MREKKDFDVVVLGGGSAGYAAARTAVAEGLSVAVVDGSEELGGLCILRGCMPSKTLIESASRATTIRRASEFGLIAEPPQVDGAAIIARKRRLIAEFVSYRTGQLQDGRFTLVRGIAQFTGRNTIEIQMHNGGRQSLTFRAALVATGSVIAHPPIHGIEQAGYLTSDDVLELADIPRSAIVLGGGAVALELASYLLGLGVKVALVQRSSHVLSAGDEDVARALEEGLQARGMNIFTGTKLLRAGKLTPTERFVEFEHHGKPTSLTAEVILQALGRRPNTDTLGLSEADVRTEAGRIVVDTTQRSVSNPSIYAAGDVCGPYEIVHIAIQQGEIAARNIARQLANKPVSELEQIDYTLRLYAVFTDPEVATVGIDEKQAEAHGVDLAVASYPFDDHGKSIVMGETHGFVKLLADRATGKLVGGAVVGPHASELIHEIVVALAAGLTPSQFAAIPHYHPTLSEIWTYPAEELSDLLKRHT